MAIYGNVPYVETFAVSTESRSWKTCVGSNLEACKNHMIWFCRAETARLIQRLSLSAPQPEPQKLARGKISLVAKTCALAIVFVVSHMLWKTQQFIQLNWIEVNWYVAAIWTVFVQNKRSKNRQSLFWVCPSKSRTAYLRHALAICFLSRTCFERQSNSSHI